MRISEPAPAKLNLALHIRRRRADGRHDIETLFAFCIDGDVVEGDEADEISLEVVGPFARAIEGENLVLRAVQALNEAAGTNKGAALRLTKNLPVSSGIGGGSADAAAALRLLTKMWSIDPAHATAVASHLGADVPACLLSMTARGEGVGDSLSLVDDPRISGAPILLVNPRIALSTRDVFAAWDGVDNGPLGNWRDGRNDLETPARALVPAIGEILDWLGGQGADLVRMSGSGATCFALFADEAARAAAAAACPPRWWHMASVLR